jgi:hypothetical protein
MTLQNTDYFLVNRAGTSYRYTWDDIQEDVELSLQIEDVFSFTGTKGATTKAETLVPLDIDNGIRLPVAGTGDYGVDGAIRYSPANSKIELFYSGSWNTASGGTAFGPTPPSPATEGDVWYDTDNGRAYVYYNDGNSSQWVEMNPAWDGGIPPGVIDASSITDGSITPIKLSPDAIVWDTAGYHAIGQAVDQTARLTVRSLNSNSNQTGLRLTQSNSTNTRTQYLELDQDESKATSSIRASNTGTDAELEIQVGSGTKMTFSENGNITTGVPLESGSGFVGDVTGNLNGSALQVDRSGTTSFDTNFYRIMFGGVTDNATPTQVKVVTNRSSLTYRPSDNRITCGLVAADLIGTADNSNLLDGLASTEFFRNSGNNTASGSNTFSGFVEFTNGTRHKDSVRVNFGNSNDVEFFFNGSHMYTDLNAGNYYIRDNNTTRFTFGRASGTFTATGNITAPNFIGNLSGNATSANSATNSTNINVAASSTNATHYVTFTQGSSGNQRPRVDGGITYNPSSNTLSASKINVSGTITASTFSGNLSGTATNADNIKIDGSTSTNLSLLLGSDTGTGNKRARRSGNLYWAGATNTLNTTNLTLTGTIQGGTYVNPIFAGTLREEVHTISWTSGFTINPDNGSFQLITLSGSSTPTQSNWVSGQSVTLMIAATSSYSVNWGTIGVSWVGGTSPQIPTSGYGIYQLWKIGSDIYGAIVGDVN